MIDVPDLGTALRTRLLLALCTFRRETSCGAGEIPLASVPLVVLAPWHVAVLAPLCSAFLGVSDVAPADLTKRVDDYVSHLPRRARTELLLCLDMIEHLCPLLLMGTGSRYSELPAEKRVRLVERLHRIDQPELRAGLSALKGVLAMGYYGDPRRWEAIGYTPWEASVQAREAPAAPWIQARALPRFVETPPDPPREDAYTHSGRALDHELSLEADVVVVGTGAGGGMAVRELARAGLSVIAVEEGESLSPRDYTRREEDMIPRIFREAGARATRDYSIRLLMGQGVGGSTLHNTNLCKRAPDAILEEWARHHGVSGCLPRDLAPVYERVERDLGIVGIGEDEHNGNNRVLARGVRALGFRGGPLRHNRQGCVGCGYCELGCAYDAKQHTAKILLPEALRTGNARVWSDIRVTHITHAHGTVLGVRGVALGPRGEARFPVAIRSKCVVLSASAVESAALAIRSGLPDPHRQQGRALRLHPGAAVAGLFDERVEAAWGIPQSYECTEFLDFEPGSDRRAWITTAFAHPVGAAATLPGWGTEHRALMRQYGHLSVLTTMIHDETKGQVDLDPEANPRVSYSVSREDLSQLVVGIRGCAQILLAAGAREVIVPTPQPLRLFSTKDLASVDETRVRGQPLTSVHPMGTMRLGDDPKTAVVKSTGEHHHLRGLFVLDGSLFPTSIGGPPQVTIYALAQHLAPHVVDRVRKAE